MLTQEQVEELVGVPDVMMDIEEGIWNGMYCWNK